MDTRESAVGRGAVILGGRLSWTGIHVHFVGIGGCGMRGLARMLVEQGCVVSGSDMSDSYFLEELRARGARVFVGHAAENVPDDAELVVATAAIPRDNAELRRARARGVAVVKYAQLLGMMVNGREGVAVAGTHGKTTTTAMTTLTLRQGGLDPSFVIGGEAPQLGGSAHAGKDRVFVVEACEFDRSFWNLRPRCAVVTNVDRDHLDCYRDLQDIILAFAGFCRNVARDGFVVVNGDDKAAMAAAEAASCRRVTFGWGEGVDWRIVDYRREGGRTAFGLMYRGERPWPLTVGYPGRHYAQNAAAAAAVARELGMSMGVVTEAIAAYSGTERRFQRLGEEKGVLVVDDYGHHPREIAATLGGAREEFGGRGRIWCVFQPHQHHRTRVLLEEFAGAFTAADFVIVPDIYAVRDSEADKRAVSSQDLVERIRARGTRAEYISTFAAVIERLARELTPGDVVMTMGAGSVDRVGRGLLKKLRSLDARGGSIDNLDAVAAT